MASSSRPRSASYLPSSMGKLNGSQTGACIALLIAIALLGCGDSEPSAHAKTDAAAPKAEAGTADGALRDAASFDSAICGAQPPCPAGTGSRIDRGCVDRQSGAREECDSDSLQVDFGVGCFVGCREPASNSKECPPCAPNCEIVFEGYFEVNEAGICAGQGTLCIPPGHAKTCYPPDRG